MPFKLNLRSKSKLKNQKKVFNFKKELKLTQKIRILLFDKLMKHNQIINQTKFKKFYQIIAASNLLTMRNKMMLIQT